MECRAVHRYGLHYQWLLITHLIWAHRVTPFSRSLSSSISFLFLPTCHFSPPHVPVSLSVGAPYSLCTNIRGGLQSSHSYFCSVASPHINQPQETSLC
ncbi:hypothetical protein FKM82_013985 [Ascaphus truei]